MIRCVHGAMFGVQSSLFTSDLPNTLFTGLNLFVKGSLNDCSITSEVEFTFGNSKSVQRIKVKYWSPLAVSVSTVSLSALANKPSVSLFGFFSKTNNLLKMF